MTAKETPARSWSSVTYLTRNPGPARSASGSAPPGSTPATSANAWAHLVRPCRFRESSRTATAPASSMPPVTASTSSGWGSRCGATARSPTERSVPPPSTASSPTRSPYRCQMTPAPTCGPGCLLRHRRHHRVPGTVRRRPGARADCPGLWRSRRRRLHRHPDGRPRRRQGHCHRPHPSTTGLRLQPRCTRRVPHQRPAPPRWRQGGGTGRGEPNRRGRLRRARRLQHPDHRRRRHHQLVLLRRRPTRVPYWPLGFADTTLRLLGSDDFAPEVKAHAATELTTALLDGDLRISISERLPLDQIAAAHEHIELGAPGRVLLRI